MRYRVVFTPVGWQVIDTVDAVDPLAEFGTGPVEYERATAKAQCLNMTDEPDAWDCAPADEASRCPRCEGYEATYHTFEGECSQAAPADEAQTVVVAASAHDAVISVPADEANR